MRRNESVMNFSRLLKNKKEKKNSFKIRSILAKYRKNAKFASKTK